jgi:hypothetical protein
VVRPAEPFAPDEQHGEHFAESGACLRNPCQDRICIDARSGMNAASPVARTYSEASGSSREPRARDDELMPRNNPL